MASSTTQTLNIHTILAEGKQDVNALILPHLNCVCPDAYVRTEIIQCLSPGRRIRPLLTLLTARQYNTDTPPHTSDILLSIELTQTASILVDDILDGEDVSHGRAVIERQWGNEKASLFSHILNALALRLLGFNSSLQGKLIAVYQAMTEGEVYDMLYPSG